MHRNSEIKIDYSENNRFIVKMSMCLCHDCWKNRHAILHEADNHKNLIMGEIENLREHTNRG